MKSATRVFLGSTLLLVTAPQLGIGEGRTKYLMVDGSLLESQSKVRLTMNPPHVSEIPAVSPSEPWESHSVGGPLTVLDFSAAEKRLYYGCNELLADGNTAEYRQCLATSADGGRSWQKPSMGLVLYNGSTSNNILPPFNNSLTGWVDIFRDDKPGVPAGERYKALVNEAGGDHIWVSADAIHFTRHGNKTKPVLIGADTQNVGVGWNDALQKYIFYIRHNHCPPSAMLPGGYCQPSHRRIAVCLVDDVLSADPWPNSFNENSPTCTDRLNQSACCMSVFAHSAPDPVDQLDIYTSAAVDYEGTLLFFPSVFFHFSNTSVNRLPSDGLTEVRFLHGGRWADGLHSVVELNYTSAWNNRSPWVSLGINRCELQGSVFQDNNSAGWCNASSGELATTSPATSARYLGHGYLTSPQPAPGGYQGVGGGEQIWQYVAASPFTHAGYTIAKHSFRSNSAVQRLISRRDGFVSVDGDYTAGIGASSGGANLSGAKAVQALPFITTVPLTVPATCQNGHVELRLNVKTSVAGFAAVELQHVSGSKTPATPIRGFELANAVPIKGNFISRAAEWATDHHLNRSLNVLAGSEVQLHVVLAAAQLYSIEFLCVAHTGQATSMKSDDDVESQTIKDTPVMPAHLSVKNAEQPRLRALWNQPWTEECQSRLPLPGGPINISAYTGIEANAYATSANGSVVGGPQFNGDVVATLYPHDGTGLYPVFACEGPPYSEETCKAVNGGSPQLGNLTAHLAQWHADIVRLFPDPASTAVVALDWEMWWPLWENNEPDNNATHYFVYGEVARRIVREKSPHLPPVAVEAQAKKEWEAACQTWLVSTMNLARTLRPQISWGFYDMPGATAENGGPALDWLWSSVDALFPSIYLSYPDLPSNVAAVTRVLTEARRVSTLSTPPKPVYAYTMAEFDDDAWNHTAPEMTFLDTDSFQLEFNYSASTFDLAGLILYGGSADGSSPERCTEVREYMTSTFLPKIEAIVGQRTNNILKTDEAAAMVEGQQTIF